MGEGEKLHGSDAAWNVINNGAEHAKDIFDATLRRHLPLPGAVGGYARSDGTDWQRVSSLALADLADYVQGSLIVSGAGDWTTLAVGTAKAVLTNDGTDVAWSTGLLDIASGKTLDVNNSLTLSGTDGKELALTGYLTIGANTNVTGGGTLALGGYTLTVPESLTVAGRNVANVFTVNQTISNTAPSLALTDTTGGAKSLTIAVDGDVADLRESAGASGSLLCLDLANNRVGLGYASPTQRLHVYDSIDNSSTDPSDYTGGIFVSNNNVSTAGTYASIGLGLNRTQDSWYIQSIWNANEDVDLAFTRDFSAGGKLEAVRISSTCYVGIGETSPGARLQINTGASTTVGLIVKGAVSQSANLTEWQNSAGTVLMAVQAGGHLAFDDGINIALDTTTGTKIGTATSQKLGFYNATPVVQPTALTAQLTGITHTAPGTPDYALQDFVDVAGDGSKGWSFANHDEANTLLSVVANLQTRVGELETKLKALGLLA